MLIHTAFPIIKNYARKSYMQMQNEIRPNCLQRAVKPLPHVHFILQKIMANANEMHAKKKRNTENQR